MSEGKKLWVLIDPIDVDANCRISETEEYETEYDNVSELYKAMVKAYGKCVSKIYDDKGDGSSKQVGWMFLGLARYDDKPEGRKLVRGKNAYLRETWVTVLTGPPVRTVKYDYYPFK